MQAVDLVVVELYMQVADGLPIGSCCSVETIRGGHTWGNDILELSILAYNSRLIVDWMVGKFA